MASWNGILTQTGLDELRGILTQNGFAAGAAFENLLQDLSPQFRAKLRGANAGDGKTQMRQALDQMNRVLSLPGGQRPLQILLESALSSVQRPEHVLRLGALLAEVEAAGYPQTAPRLPSTPIGIPAPVPPPAVAAHLPALNLTRFEAPFSALPGSPAAPLERAPAPTPAPGERLRAALPSARTMNPGEIEREALIAGNNETLSISFLEGGLAAARSVFKIVVHSHFDGEPVYGPDDAPLLSFGTAWMIAPGLAITNYHVVNARRERDPPADPIDYAKQVETARLVADFHDPNAEPAGVRLPADALAAADAELDFAVFRVPAGLAERQPLQLRRHAVRKRAPQALGTRVNLLQHPGGGIMKLGFRNNFVVVGNNDVLAYLTDTAHGSSGSPVMDDGWKVAALHAGSEDIGNIEISLQGNRVKRRNFGVPIPRIRDHLKANNEALHRMIFGPAEG